MNMQEIMLRVRLTNPSMTNFHGTPLIRLGNGRIIVIDEMSAMKKASGKWIVWPRFVDDDDQLARSVCACASYADICKYMNEIASTRVLTLAEQFSCMADGDRELIDGKWVEHRRQGERDITDWISRFSSVLVHPTEDQLTSS